MPKVKKNLTSFADEFSDVDFVYGGHPENYNRKTHPVWEYDAGPRGHPDWRRLGNLPGDGTTSNQPLTLIGFVLYCSFNTAI